jgi:serine/threonine-protein kinase
MTTEAVLNERYYLQEVLGAGGMSIVFRAQDRTLERLVAIKVLRQKYSSDPAFRERFRQEARAAANLSHPNIVTVHDFGLDNDRLFIVMEYVPGTNLKDILEERGRLSVEEAVPLAIQMCAGVGYAHRAGLVHCDIKPHNVLVSPDKRVKVTDFGIARALASISPDEKADIVWGSPQYFSPEQARGLAPSPASDVYGIGVILYQVLTGRLPFSAESGVELARLHRDSSPTPVSKLVPEIPETINRIVMKVLSKEPSSRYRTADQLGRVLQSFANQSVSSKDQETRASQPSVRSAPVPSPARPAAPLPDPGPERQAEREAAAQLPVVDWINIVLALLALVAVGGLIPFWIWVYYILNPPLR